MVLSLEVEARAILSETAEGRVVPGREMAWEKGGAEGGGELEGGYF